MKKMYASRKEATRAWNAAHPDLVRAMARKSMAKWRAKNGPEIIRRRHNLYYAENRDRWFCYRLKNQYGITLDRYDDLLKAQDGVCAICKKPETRVVNGRLVRLAIDHDHRCCPGLKSCGKCVRGLLCEKCNKGIGLLGEDPSVLRTAIIYLDRKAVSRDQERDNAT